MDKAVIWSRDRWRTAGRWSSTKGWLVNFNQNYPSRQCKIRPAFRKRLIDINLESGWGGLTIQMIVSYLVLKMGMLMVYVRWDVQTMRMERWWMKEEGQSSNKCQVRKAISPSKNWRQYPLQTYIQTSSRTQFALSKIFSSIPSLYTRPQGLQSSTCSNPPRQTHTLKSNQSSTPKKKKKKKFVTLKGIKVIILGSGAWSFERWEGHACIMKIKGGSGPLATTYPQHPPPSPPSPITPTPHHPNPQHPSHSRRFISCLLTVTNLYL